MYLSKPEKAMAALLEQSSELPFEGLLTRPSGKNRGSSSDIQSIALYVSRLTPTRF